jgi:DNA-directed RNA polymerase subunit alpha
VKEDVTEIILNLKKVVVSSEIDSPQTCVIQKDKKGPITAGDIKTPAGVEIANPSHYLAYLNDKSSVNIELTIERGRGYVPAELSKTDDIPAGVLPIDAIYSPVLRVTYKVDATRVEQRTDFDKLTIDVISKPSISPRTALASAGSTLVEIFSLAKDLDQEAEGIELNAELLGGAGAGYKKPDVINESTPLSMLDLNKRTVNMLDRADINTIGDLMKYSHEQLLEFKNFGEKSVELLEDMLAEHGFVVSKTSTPGNFDIIG